MADARIMYNTSCLKCSACEPEMVKVGVLPFCNKCYAEEFKGEAAINPRSDLYMKWLEEYQRQE